MSGERIMMRLLKCPRCDCVFLTEEDLGRHWAAFKDDSYHFARLARRHYWADPSLRE